MIPLLFFPCGKISEFSTGNLNSDYESHFCRISEEFSNAYGVVTLAFFLWGIVCICIGLVTFQIMVSPKIYFTKIVWQWKNWTYHFFLKENYLIKFLYNSTSSKFFIKPNIHFQYLLLIFNIEFNSLRRRQ